MPIVKPGSGKKHAYGLTLDIKKTRLFLTLGGEKCVPIAQPGRGKKRAYSPT